MTKSFAILSGGLLVWLAATTGHAGAQEFSQGLQDPRVLSPVGLGPSYSGLTGAGIGLQSKKPEFGIAAGDFIIQPRLFLESAYQTNFFRADERNTAPEGVATLRARPGVAVFNPRFDKVAFSLGLDVDVFVPLSGQEQVSDKTNVGGAAKLAVALFPKSAFTLTLHDRFARTLWMRPTVAVNANRNWNQAGVDLSFHPGGRALDFTLGYAYELKRYDNLDSLDTDNHALRFLASWRFYPMSYAFLEATVDVFSYTEEATGDALTRIGNSVPGTPVKAYLGLSGYITERLALLVRAGYGNTLLDRAPDDFSSFIGQARLSYRFGEKTVLHAGVARDVELTALGGYYEYFRAYGSFTQRFGDLIEVHADLAYDIRTFGQWEPASTGATTPVASDSERSEDWVRAGIVLDFDVSRLFGITAGYRYEAVISDFAITTNGRTNFVGYGDHRVYASVNLRY